MTIAILGLFLGLVIGIYLPLNIPPAYASYTAIGLLAAIDTAFGGIRSSLEGKFDHIIFITGFFSNMLIAASMTYLGDRLGIPIYYAAIFAFGVRIFQNLAIIRRFYIDKLFSK
jgi:small basic protein